LKYDWCRADITSNLTQQPAFEHMRDEIARTGRDIVYSISEYGFTKPWTWAAPIANSWRTTSDLNPTWASIAKNIQSQAELYPYSGPGAWNDPDMLQVGNGALTLAESRSHVAMWTMFAAPLFIGTDINRLSFEVSQILENDRLVAIDQDPLGKQAQLITDSLFVQVSTRPLADGGQAFALFNKINVGQTLTVTVPNSSHSLVDVWTGKSVPVAEKNGNLTWQLDAQRHCPDARNGSVHQQGRQRHLPDLYRRGRLRGERTQRTDVKKDVSYKWHPCLWSWLSHLDGTC
jgi:LysM repeat protein